MTAHVQSQRHHGGMFPGMQKILCCVLRKTTAQNNKRVLCPWNRRWWTRRFPIQQIAVRGLPFRNRAEDLRCVKGSQDVTSTYWRNVWERCEDLAAKLVSSLAPILGKHQPCKFPQGTHLGMNKLSKNKQHTATLKGGQFMSCIIASWSFNGEYDDCPADWLCFFSVYTVFFTAFEHVFHPPRLRIAWYRSSPVSTPQPDVTRRTSPSHRRRWKSRAASPAAAIARISRGRDWAISGGRSLGKKRNAHVIT